MKTIRGHQTVKVDKTAFSILRHHYLSMSNINFSLKTAQTSSSSSSFSALGDVIFLLRYRYYKSTIIVLSLFDIVVIKRSISQGECEPIFTNVRYTATDIYLSGYEYVVANSSPCRRRVLLSFISTIRLYARAC